MRLLHKQPAIGIVPGFGSGKGSYQPLVCALRAEGYEVLLFPSARLRGMFCAKQGHPRALTRQARAIIRQAKARGIDNLVLIGHSLGGPIATVTAAIAPNLVSRVVLVCSASIHADKFWLLARRLLGKAQGDATYAKTTGDEAQAMLRLIRKEALRYIIANPLRALAEGWALARFSVLDLLVKHRIDARFVYGERDTLFTCEAIEAALSGHEHSPNGCIKIGISHDPQNKSDEARRLVAALVKHRFLPTP